jgi:hypothetical protein
MRIFRDTWIAGLVALLGLVLIAGPAAASPTAAPRFFSVKRAGPVSIQGANNFQTLLTFQIPAGNYALEAKLDVRSAASGPRNVYCNVSRHYAGGPWADYAGGLVTVLPSPASEARQTISIVGGWHGDYTPGTTDTLGLRCQQPGNNGDVLVESMVVQAFQMGKVNGDIFNSDGAPYTIVNCCMSSIPPVYSGPVTDTGAQFWSVGTANVDVGSPASPTDWLVLATLQIKILSTATVTCRVSMGGDFDQQQVRRADGTFSTLAFAFVHHSTADIAHREPIKFACGRDGGNANINFENVVAMRVGDLVNEAFPGTLPLPPGVAPKVIAGYKDGPIPVGENSNFAVMGTLHVPPGKWTVLSKLYVGNAGGQLVSCRTSLGSVASDSVAGAAENGDLPFQPPGARHPFEMLLAGPVRSSAGANIVVTCAKLAGQGIIDEDPQAWFLKVVAIKTGPLTRLTRP